VPVALRPATPPVAVPAWVGRARKPKRPASTISLVALAILVLNPCFCRCVGGHRRRPWSAAISSRRQHIRRSTPQHQSRPLGGPRLTTNKPPPDTTTPTTNKAQSPIVLQALPNPPGNSAKHKCFQPGNLSKRRNCLAGNSQQTQLTRQAGRQQGRKSDLPASVRLVHREAWKPATLRSLTAAPKASQRFDTGRFAPHLARRRKGTRSAGRLRLRNGGHHGLGQSPKPRKGKVSRSGPP